MQRFIQMWITYFKFILSLWKFYAFIFIVWYMLKMWGFV
jgi:hypothetical protein